MAGRDTLPAATTILIEIVRAARVPRLPGDVDAQRRVPRAYIKYLPVRGCFGSRVRTPQIGRRLVDRRAVAADRHRPRLKNQSSTRPPPDSGCENLTACASSQRHPAGSPNRARSPASASSAACLTMSSRVSTTFGVVRSSNHGDCAVADDGVEIRRAAPWRRNDKNDRTAARTFRRQTSAATAPPRTLRRGGIPGRWSTRRSHVRSSFTDSGTLDRFQDAVR